MLICELPDGRLGGVPEWMTDAAACAVLSIGEPLVAIEALSELRGFVDAIMRSKKEEGPEEQKP
jgi:hypothetical protein